MSGGEEDTLPIEDEKKEDKKPPVTTVPTEAPGTYVPVTRGQEYDLGGPYGDPYGAAYGGVTTRVKQRRDWVKPLAETHETWFATPRASVRVSHAERSVRRLITAEGLEDTCRDSGDLESAVVRRRWSGEPSQDRLVRLLDESLARIPQMIAEGIQEE